MLGVRISRQLSQSIFALIMLCVWSAAAHAQNIDTIAPVVELEELAEGVADQSQVFTVLVAEDQTLKDVTLYYRRAGQLPFIAARMEPLGNTGYFSASVPTELDDTRTFEYYIQARDEAGNRTVSGFAFDPYLRTIAPSPEQLNTASNNNSDPVSASTSVNAKPPLLKRRWVQVTLGVIAIGAIASLAGDDGEDTQVVPLTFNLQ